MKRCLSLVMALILALSCFSAVVFADEPETNGVHTATARILEGTLGTNGTLKASGTGGTLNESEGSFSWDGKGRGRFTFNQNPKLYIGRTYQFISM